MPIDMNKIEAVAPGLVGLAEKAHFSLSKHGLDGQTAEVELVLDRSGSMRPGYASGRLQELADRVLALSTQLDNDGAVPLRLFHDFTVKIGTIDLSTYQGAVDRLTRSVGWGATAYAPPINAVAGDTQVGGLPKFVLFLTDGSPQDRTAAERALINASQKPIFFKFLSIGPEKIKFLEKLDDLKVGRRGQRLFDNADYKAVASLGDLGDAQLFDMLLDEWAAALKSMRELDLIA